MDDYYKTLELEHSASSDEIKANYRRLAMRWHPDRNQGSAEAEEKFKRISEAYSVLSDESKRRDYDAYSSSAAFGSAAYGDSAYGTSASSFGEGRASDGYGNGFAGGFRPFTAEQAAYMFMNEMYSLAMELTMQNVGWQDIAAELVRRGCPDDVANEIAKKIEERRKTMIRTSARPYFLRSAIEGAFGLGLFATFAGVGLGLLGFLGAIMTLSGAYNLVRALYFLLTGRAPKR